MSGLNRLPLLLLIALGLAGAGCGDDDKNNGDSDDGDDEMVADAGGGGDDAGGGGAGDCIGTYEGKSAEALIAAGGEGPCVTETQINEICEVGPNIQAATAGRACFLASKMGDALIECTIEGPDGVDGVRDVAPSLSDECLDCYARSVECSAANCGLQCAQNPDGDACITCRADKGCTSGFFECSGLPAPEDL